MGKSPPGLLKQLLGWLRKRGWALPLLRPNMAAGELTVKDARDAEVEAIDKDFIQAELKDIAKSLRNM